ncbi:MAG: sigma-70 family RNA polymerase sigma factor [Planctomycetales bacterium]|nr:sigma-70 family RNA polymerase sigma factor [Planctomycetales bacterium]
MQDKPNNSAELLEAVQSGDTHALAELFSHHQSRIRHLVDMQLDTRLTGRVDTDDVLQEVYLDAAARIQHFVNEHSGSLFVWLRLITIQTVANVHRRHFGTKMRDVTREMSIFRPNNNATTSLALQLLGHATSPSQAAMREETAARLIDVINAMSDIDKQILRLRHFEQLSNTEVSEVLDIQPKAASIRYIRALKRLKDVLDEMPEFNGEQE